MNRTVLSASVVTGALLFALGVRAWGLLHGELVWHPDEIFMVVIPLRLLSGDLNPHYFHYPSLHYYLLGLAYAVLYLLDLYRGLTGNLDEWVALHGLFEMERLRDVARWVSVAFSCGTVVVTMSVARRVSGSTAAVITACALAASVLCVRQSQIASVDLTMVFWFVLALWSALRLLDGGRRRHYLISGLFVGLCAGTKYPGVAAAGAVVGAHLLAGGRILDRRLWLAGGVSLVVFSLASPFVWIDFGTFREHFLFQVEHVRQGTQEISLPIFHHLWFSLRHNLGEPAWMAMLGAGAWALYRRDRQIGVVLCAFVVAYASISWGELVFVRYAMPLLPLQAILVGVAIVAIADRLALRFGYRRLWLGLVAVTILALPAVRSMRVAQISAAVDTRTQAREWLEAHVSSGARCCNFGGWGGGVQVRTFEQLWWLLVRHQEAFGLADLATVAPSLRPRPSPYYSFTAGGDRSASETGSWDLVDDVQCDHVVIHDHPLPSSRLDSAFTTRLPIHGQRLASFSPGEGIGKAVFDDMDAYYVPIADTEGIDRPGPYIEIWRIDDQPPTHRERPSVTERLADAHALLAMSAARDGRMALALRALHHASQYDATNPRAVAAWAYVSEKTGRFQDSETAYRELSRIDPGRADGLEGLARLLTAQGRLQEAADTRGAAAALQPRSATASIRWAQALSEAGREAEALRVSQEAQAMPRR